MIPQFPREQRHRATYDEQGNIVLPSDAILEEVPHIAAVEPVQQPTVYEEYEEWEPLVVVAKPLQSIDAHAENQQIQHSEVDEMPSSMQNSADDVWSAVRVRLYDVTHQALQENSQQWRTTMQESVRMKKTLCESARSSLKGCISVLRQPVWIPRANKPPKQYGRGTLFILDIVRFGGTFAALFAILFTALNYQSFWAIAQSYVDPLSDTSLGRPAADTPLLPSLEASEGTSAEGLLAALPPVGPPDHRLVIPKLHLNVPIVVPSMDALLQEDWAKLEADIQHGLQDGVVHYPGTAEPGQPGNFFITGHSSYFPWAPGAYKSVFARLHELHVGDEYWVYYKGDKHRYIVQDKREIKPSDVSVLDQPVNRRTSTLMTCTPVGTTLRRLVLTAQEVDPVTGEALAVGARSKERTLPDVRLDLLPI